jgi:hypothetical protein
MYAFDIERPKTLAEAVAALTDDAQAFERRANADSDT